MKLRKGFVSNSSSSSFIIELDKLTANQIHAIKNHTRYARENDYFEIEWKGEEDQWNVYATEEHIIGDTFMDNFDMHAFFQRIDVSLDDVEWEY